MPRKSSDEDILATARERFRLCEEAEVEIRRDALDDLKFAAGDQWRPADRTQREGAGGINSRPCLTFNKLIGPLNQTANEARMNASGIQVHPVDSSSDPDTAKVIEGMIRHIEYVCKADEVYETAVEQSTAGSFGAFRINTRYCGSQSFDQELRIERVADPFSIYVDPYARQADKSDMRFAFEVEIFPRDEYEEDYGDSAVAKSFDFYEGMRPSLDPWVTKSGVMVAKYWQVETEKRTLMQVQFRDGTRTPVFKEDLPAEMPRGTEIARDASGKPIERETEIRKVRWYKINGVEILDRGDWLGQWIPIFPVLGKEMYVGGERKLFSLVRFAKDPQRFYNYCKSSEAETLMLGTKAPWIGVKGAFKDPRWATSNVVPYAYLEYEPVDIGGQPAPPPQRNVFEPPIQAVSLAAAQASDDIKATTGIFDASLGARSNETSGIAIRQRQSQAGLSNAHFIDNLNRAIRMCGIALCDLIPKIYDGPREVRILGIDRTQQIVKVNQQWRDDKGVNRCYDLSSGQFDATITVGPSYPTQRQENWDVLTQFAQAYPQLLQIAGDLVFKSADFPGASEIADRFRKTLPPGLADEPQTGPQQVQMLAAQFQQSQQTIAALTQELQQASEVIRTKQAEHESNERIEAAKIASSDRQAAMKAQVDLITTEAKLKSNEDITLLKTQVASLQAQIARMYTGAASAGDELGEGSATVPADIGGVGAKLGGVGAATPPQ